jgi:phosphatidylinositol phospholipase C delta
MSQLGSGNMPARAPQLEELAVYFQAVKLRSFEFCAQNFMYYHMSSMGEKKLMRLVKKSSSQLVQHTMRFVVRVYPHGARISSSNYDPQVSEREKEER